MYPNKVQIIVSSMLLINDFYLLFLLWILK